ncbi:MAG TPA: UDP-N-acetylmuramate dehydrogenase [Acidimicrobiales bacterium]|nr:UDP-N-acetylmuramate dehydrogenase [Acidimicrobiales bacterium]
MTDQAAAGPVGPDSTVATLDAAASTLGDRAERRHPLGALTTYRVGGPAALYMEAHSLEDLRLASAAVRAGSIPVLVLGKGSNLLVADAGFPGLVVSLGEEFATLEIAGRTVRAGAGVTLPVLARRSAAAGLTGLEWCVGVPGSVGGGVRMNAGGHGSDMAHCLAGWEMVDLTGDPDGPRTPADLDYGYRHSSVLPHQVVVSASFELVPGERARSEATISEIVRWRREHQPGGQNAGSVFANPEGNSAGRLIEAAGLKGHRLGTAAVSEKHANFIQADPGGSADDVWTLMEEVRREVRRLTGVELRTEVRAIGFRTGQHGGSDQGSSTAQEGGASS